MTGTGRSAPAAPAGSGGLPPQVVRTLVAQVVALVAVGLAQSAIFVLRGEPLVALSAVPLVPAFGAGMLWHRRRDARASRWLADPPYTWEERP